MIKVMLENYIKRTKNSEFQFDKNLSSSLIFSFAFKKLISLLRGLRMILVNRKPNKIFFGKSVDLFNKKNMIMGNNVNIGDFVKLNALGVEPLRIGNNVNIGSYSQLIISTTFNDLGRYITIGNNVGVGEFSYLGGAGGLSIGNDTIIGQYFSAHPENHNYSVSNILIRQQGTTRQGITIGSNCWIGSKVTVLDGVDIGNNCVVAAGAVVTKSFPDSAVLAGVPAKVIQQR